MCNGHFREASHQQESNTRADGVADQHRRAGKANRETATKKQTGADCATDGDHRELPGREGPPQSFFAFLNRIEAAGAHRTCTQTSVN